MQVEERERTTKSKHPDHIDSNKKQYRQESEAG